MKKSRESNTQLLKAPTGIGGFDELTYGGLPQGQATVIQTARGGHCEKHWRSVTCWISVS